jgi:hypothetical protein
LDGLRQANLQYFDIFAFNRTRIGQIKAWCGRHSVLADEELLAIVQRRHGNRPQGSIWYKDQGIDG